MSDLLFVSNTPMRETAPHIQSEMNAPDLPDRLAAMLDALPDVKTVAFMYLDESSYHTPLVEVCQERGKTVIMGLELTPLLIMPEDDVKSPVFRKWRWAEEGVIEFDL